MVEEIRHFVFDCLGRSLKKAAFADMHRMACSWAQDRNLPLAAIEDRPPRPVLHFSARGRLRLAWKRRIADLMH